MNPLAKGHRAGEILDDPVFQEAVEAAKARVYKAWVKSSSPAEREDLWRQHRMIDALPRELRSIRGDGAVARHDLGVA